MPGLGFVLCWAKGGGAQEKEWGDRLAFVQLRLWAPSRAAPAQRPRGGGCLGTSTSSSPQPQHSHLVIQQLLSHLDANSRSAAIVRAGIVEVLSEAAVIAATGSVGKVALKGVGGWEPLKDKELPLVGGGLPFQKRARHLREVSEPAFLGWKGQQQGR